MLQISAEQGKLEYTLLKGDTATLVAGIERSDLSDLPMKVMDYSLHTRIFGGQFKGEAQ
jgi:hypothetical protein